MKEKFIKWFMAFNVWLIQASRGRLGTKLGTQTILLLETTGRKSGKQHTIPIAYFEHGQHYIIVASNWGRDQQANWYLNLKQHPEARLNIHGTLVKVRAHEAEAQEYQALWKFVTERHPPYMSYQQKTSRKIPIMVFTPINGILHGE